MASDQTETGVRALGLLLGMCFVGACAGPALKSQSPSSLQKTAHMNLFVKCGTPYNGESQADVDTVLATVRYPWSANIKVELEFLPGDEFEQAGERPTAQWAFSRMYTRIVQGFETTDEGRVDQGIDSFDDRKITSGPGSLVRQRLAYGEPRVVRVGRAIIDDCQLYFLRTDFGPQETLECPSVGTIAVDNLGIFDGYQWVKGSVNTRIVATQAIDWPYSPPGVKNIFEKPPYATVLAARVQQFARNADFDSACNVDMMTLLLSGP